MTPTEPQTTYLIVAIVAAVAGLALLRSRWRRAGTYHALLLLTAWLLLAGASGAASIAYGAEFGISYAFAGISLTAMLLVIANSERRPRADTAQARDVIPTTSRARKWLTFITAGVLAGAACAPLTIAISRLLPVALPSQMAIAVVLFPVLWSVAAYWTTATGRTAVKAVLFLSVAVGTTLMLPLLGTPL